MNLIQKIQNTPNVHLAFYAYSLNIASLANGDTDTDLVNIQNDSQFIWTKTSYFCDIAGAVQTDSSRVIPLINCMLTNTGSGRQFFNDLQPIPSIAGEGSKPFILPQPALLDKNATINATFVNYSNATTYANLTLTLHGFRVYNYSNS